MLLKLALLHLQAGTGLNRLGAGQNAQFSDPDETIRQLADRIKTYLGGKQPMNIWTNDQLVALGWLMKLPNLNTKMIDGLSKERLLKEKLFKAALAEIDKKDFEKAENLLVECAKGDTSEWTALSYYNLGYMYLSKLRRYQDAATAFEKSIDLDPSFAMAHMNLGGALLQAGEKNLLRIEKELLASLGMGVPKEYSMLIHLMIEKVKMARKSN
jgi:tetratricopeptide (TPR) repeat protein